MAIFKLYPLNIIVCSYIRLYCYCMIVLKLLISIVLKVYVGVASDRPGRRGYYESNKYGVEGVCEAFTLDRHRHPRRHANGKGAGI
jgi:hypothetical protein